MNKHKVLRHLVVGLPVLALCPLSDNLTFLAILCLLDIVLLFTGISEDLTTGDLNLLSPALWGIAGYLCFGQLPAATDVLMFPDTYSVVAEPASMIRLILVGYRFLLLGICCTLSGTPLVAKAKLPSPMPRAALLLVVIGFLGRVFIQNNVSESFVGQWQWYYSFAFNCTPVGLALLISGNIGRHKQSRSMLTGLTVALGVLSALIDVSRKDTGVNLLGIALWIFFSFRPDIPFIRLTVRRIGLVCLVLAFLSVVLMATRAYSWTVTNHTDFASELDESFSNRRANDLTVELAFVMEITPAIYPFFNGLTYASLLPIPRVLWPDRVPAHSYFVGLQIKRIPVLEYHEQYLGVNQLSVSAHMLGEGYANFGRWGAYGVEVVFGLLLGLYETALKKGRLITLRLLLPMTLFFILTQQRGDVAMMNSGWISTAGVLWLALKAHDLVSAKVGPRRMPGDLHRVNTGQRSALAEH